MMRPDEEGMLVCRRCGCKKEKEKPSVVLRDTIKEKEEVILEEESAGMPTIKIKCSDCGNDTAYWWLRQLRSADEAEVRFFRCTKCKKTWREYN
ncbi:MAG: transcription factor S [Halobacteriota archaeon]|nr:transcription factor S [Halobacteriota archaeon]